MHFLCICRFQREILYPELHLRLHLFAQSKTRACARALDSFPRSWRKFCAEPPLRDAVLRVSIKQEKPPMPSFGFPPEAEEGSCVLRFAFCVLLAPRKGPPAIVIPPASLYRSAFSFAEVMSVPSDICHHALPYGLTQGVYIPWGINPFTALYV